MRAFIAVEIPEQVRADVARGLSELRRRLPAARWVGGEGVHVTLRFLGEQDEALLAELGERVAAEARSLVPATVCLEGGGFFPHERRPRVAWLGGRAPELAGWAAAVERCAVALGVAPEPRAFSLHLTLARLERPWGAGDVETFSTVVSKWRLPEFTAHELVLFASELRPSGAVHTPLRRITVGS
jgi:RNA 2',3'-cyclic 3'-phosphodiesterase